LDDWRARAELRWREDACVQEVAIAQRRAVEWRAAADEAHAEVAVLRQMLERSETASRSLGRRWEAALEQQLRQQVRVDEAKRAMVQSALDVQARSLRSEFLGELEFEHRRFEHEASLLRECADESRQQRGRLDGALRALEVHQQPEEVRQRSPQGPTGQEEPPSSTPCQPFSAGPAGAPAARSAGAAPPETMAAPPASPGPEELLCSEELAELRGAHAAELAALRAEHNGERLALASLKDDVRRLYDGELASVRAAQSELREAVENAVRAEAEEVLVARRAFKSEAVSVRAHKAALREELRGELQAELHGKRWAELQEEMRAEVFEEVANDRRSDLRRALCRGLRQELRDQLRCELRSELRSEHRTTHVGVIPGSVSSHSDPEGAWQAQQQQQQHSPGVPSPSSIAEASLSPSETSPGLGWLPAPGPPRGERGPGCLRWGLAEDAPEARREGRSLEAASLSPALSSSLGSARAAPSCLTSARRALGISSAHPLARGGSA